MQHVPSQMDSWRRKTAPFGRFVMKLVKCNRTSFSSSSNSDSRMPHPTVIPFASLLVVRRFYWVPTMSRIKPKELVSSELDSMGTRRTSSRQLKRRSATQQQDSDGKMQPLISAENYVIRGQRRRSVMSRHRRREVSDVRRSRRRQVRAAISMSGSRAVRSRHTVQSSCLTRIGMLRNWKTTVPTRSNSKRADVRRVRRTGFQLLSRRVRVSGASRTARGGARTRRVTSLRSWTSAASLPIVFREQYSKLEWNEQVLDKNDKKISGSNWKSSTANWPRW